LVRTALLEGPPGDDHPVSSPACSISVNQLKTNATAAQAAANQQIKTLTGKALTDSVLTASFSEPELHR